MSIVEKMARAIFASEGKCYADEDRMFQPVPWEELDDDGYQCIRDGYRDKARAAITATGLTEAQLEGLANGTMVVVSVVAAASDVLAERERQQSVEGWTPEHDDAHSCMEMTRAANAYALNAVHSENDDTSYNHWLASDEQYTPPYPSGSPPKNWPWESAWWKPSTPRRDLVKAGALILAEIERLDRAMLAAKEG